MASSLTDTKTFAIMRTQEGVVFQGIQKEFMDSDSGFDVSEKERTIDIWRRHHVDRWGLRLCLAVTG